MHVIIFATLLATAALFPVQAASVGASDLQVTPAIAEPKHGAATSSEEGLSVQTGYEGYLVPAGSDDETDDISGTAALASFVSSLFNGEPAIDALLGAVEGTDRSGGGHKVKLLGAHGKPLLIPVPSFLKKHSKFSKLLHSPKKAILAKVLAKGLFAAFAALIVLLLTGGVAAAVCTFTPLCTISFLARENVRSLDSSDSLTNIVYNVLGAIEKFQQMQIGSEE